MADLDKLQAAAGGTTPAAISAFQHKSHVPATGLPDPPTLIAAGVYPAPAPGSGSGFARAFFASESQIPQWAWLGAAAASGLVAWLAWRSANPARRR